MRPSLLPMVAAIVLAVPVTLSAGEGPGLVVEKVEPGRAGDRAGIRAGDAITGWTRLTGASAPASGRLLLPADLDEAESVQAPLGPLTLEVVRDGESRALVLDAGEFGLTTRPVLPAAALPAYARARAAPRAERGHAMSEAARNAREAGDTVAALWLSLEAARLSGEVGQREPALAALRGAEALVGDDPVRRIQLLEARSRALLPLNDLRQAAEALQQALDLREQEWGADGLAAAAGLAAAGAMAWKGTDIPRAQPLYEQALRIREALAPGSMAHAWSLRQMENVTWARGDVDGAEALLTRALGSAEALEPRGRLAGTTVLAQGNVALNRGHAAEAERHYRRVLDMRAGIRPWEIEVCYAHSNLALLALNHGDLDTAEQEYEESFRCRQEATPGEPPIERYFQRALIATERGDYAAARGFYEQANELSRKAHGADEPFILSNLGEIASKEGDLRRARGYVEQSLAGMEKKYGRDTTWFAETLTTLGQVAARQGKAAEARAVLEEALAVYERKGTDIPSSAQVVRALGLAAEAAHQPERARALYERALATFERLTPGTYLEAEALHDLGRIRAALGAPAEALELLRRAVDILERSATRVGGGQEGLSAFRAKHADLYRGLIAALLEAGDVDEALHVVERSRGRVLLEWLARRGVGVPDEVSAESRRELEDVDGESERVLGRLQGLDPSRDTAEVDQLLTRLRDLRQQREAWEDRLRERSPRYAALRYPVALDAAGVRSALDPGTVLLSYVVFPEETHLFVVAAGSGAAKVYTLPVGTVELQRRVAAFRRRLRFTGGVAALRRQARALFALLMGPAEPDIEAGTRVLISADGPLHLLPFGALVRKNAYVVEWRPLHFVNSVTVYAELRRLRRAPDARPSRLLAFGDPRPGARYASRFPPLPGSRREVKAIEREFPSRAQAYLGTSASEGRVQRPDGSFLALHFATHAFIDEHLPLDSALVLSPGPGPENGLLQAWEIFDRVRLDAELVTLSGCETALGREMGGEGLMGLTRAFFYAGARSVVASLWSVSDHSTAMLMERFYRRLAAGAPKDEALRAAQVGMIHAGGEGAHPFRWAAFELFGDWR